MSEPHTHIPEQRKTARMTLLKELAETEQLEGRPVRLRELAAVLRFADELAEGPQRTSEFMQAEGLYESEAQRVS